MMGAALIAAALSGAGGPAPNPIYWFNLRNSAAGPTGFVGDGPTSTYLTGLIYPENTIGPFTGGQVADSGGAFANYVGYAAYEHQAGRAPYNAGTDNRTTRISGIVNGAQYRIFMSQGSPGVTANSQMSVYSGNRTGLLYATPNVSVPDGDFADILGTVFGDAAAWVAGQQGVDITAASSDFYFARGALATGNANAIGIQAL